MAERKPNRKLTDQEVEYMLAKAVVQQVPDIYQQASSAPITPLTVVDEIVPRQFPRQRLRWQRLALFCPAALPKRFGRGIRGMMNCLRNRFSRKFQVQHRPLHCPPLGAFPRRKGTIPEKPW